MMEYALHASSCTCVSGVDKYVACGYRSSASHEVYLRDWAKGIDAPIISIDYGLVLIPLLPLVLPSTESLYCIAPLVLNGGAVRY